MSGARSVPFTFGIALIPRANARDWRRVQRLLDLTLASVRAQTDPDFRVLIAVHDRPELAQPDPRVEFIDADWPVEPPGPHNGDSGRKKHLLNDLVLEHGGGLFTLLDADDWLDRRWVECTRASLDERHAGALAGSGCAVDLQTLRAAWLPDPRIFDGGIHRLCGSTTVAWLRPDDPDPVRRDPFGALRSHHQWREKAAEHGVELAVLPAATAYVVNTDENHSTRHGPHGDWWRGFLRAVDRHGEPVDGALAARFGLQPEALNVVRRGSGVDPA